MKKIAKIAAGLTMTAAFAVACGALAGCDKGSTGEAYGLVHGAGYVGYAKIKTDGDKVKDLTLTEVCFPTQVKAGDGVAEADKAGDYYKKVSYGNVTMVYDTDMKSYMVGNDTLKEYFKSEANAKAYYEAVVSNSVKVEVGGDKKGGVMTKNALCKDDNGYWDGDKIGSGQLGWKANRDKTVQYVKNNGVKNLSTLVKDGTWKDSAGVDTGATWNDLNSVKEGSLSYAQLIYMAYTNSVR